MTRDAFMDLLRRATADSIDFAKRFVTNDLPAAVRYRVLLSQSFDGNATSEDRVYPEDEGREIECLSPDEVGDLLSREQRCPAWIDVSVEAQSSTETLVRLLCCGRFVNDPRRMYYMIGGMGPFGIKSPDLPLGFVEGETKFTLPMVKPCRSR